ncbi:hypothetical protein Ddc_15572 [Ditylenchus destructor]|nr:hypothetical protein Ddc_15572 [Ditylenchus destructor]
MLSKTSLKTWDDKFADTGAVTSKKSARRKAVRTSQNIAAVSRNRCCPTEPLLVHFSGRKIADFQMKRHQY